MKRTLSRIGIGLLALSGVSAGATWWLSQRPYNENDTANLYALMFAVIATLVFFFAGLWAWGFSRER